MKTKPDLSFWKLWNLSFGFFGVQIAYALQNANNSRIFTTIGADPHSLSYFWILPPLMGLLVQPIVGVASDRTWNRFGRRLPYLILGALIAIVVMCLLPNAGSFSFTIGGAILFGLVALMLLDSSINMAMQPFKMLVGDMVNEKQKGKAYSIQSFLCNAGSVVGFILPFVLTWLGIQNTPRHDGEVPDSVIWSFYIGAAILFLCVLYTLIKVKEWPPQLYNEYNNITENSQSKKQKTNLVKLLKDAPTTFWTVGLVQFFCWFAFLFLWTYGLNTTAMKAFKTPDTQTVKGIQTNKDLIEGKKILLEQDNKQYLISDDGKELVKGVLVNGRFYAGSTIIVNKQDTIVKDHSIMNDKEGIAKVELDKAYNCKGIKVDNEEIEDASSYDLKNYFYGLNGSAQLITADVIKEISPNKFDVQNSSTYKIDNINECRFEKKTVLNSASRNYNDAGDWFSILLGVQAIASVAWAVLLPKLGSRKFSYILSLVLGGGGFIMSAFITNQWILIIPFALMGCAWAAMLAWPFTILTNSLKGGNIGTYLGLFNCTICLPQIVAAIVGGWILEGFTKEGELAPQYVMMVLGGISLVIGSLCVLFIKESKPEDDDMKVQETPVISDNI